MPISADAVDFVLTGCALIDGTERDPIAGGALHIRDGRIAWAGTLRDLPRDIMAVQRRDVSGCTAIPGLIDAHAHVCWNGRESVPDLARSSRDSLLLHAVKTVGDIVRTGTTTLRDLGGQAHLEMSLRSAIEAGVIVGPRLRLSGQFITITGGHCHFIGREADGTEDVRRAAREQVKAGADNIKVMATGGVATAGQDIEGTQMTVEEMAAAVEVARASGRTSAAHAHGSRGIRNAVMAGVDSVEHGSCLDEETADFMREHDVALVLTLGLAREETPPLSPTARHEAERIQGHLPHLRRRLRDTVRLAREKRLRIASGSDSGGNPLVPHDFSMARELEELVRHGVSPLDAIRIATRGNAAVLRRDGELGSLERGKLADLVLLDGDPVADIRNVRRVHAVYLGGRELAPGLREPDEEVARP